MDESRDKLRRYRLGMIVSGVVTVLAPIIGLSGTVHGMMGAFDKMGTTGIADPDSLSEKIGEVLISTGAGLAVAFVCLSLCITFAVLMAREKRKIERMAAARE